MYFVIQVTSRNELKMMDIISKRISNNIILDIFVPSRKRLKKVDSSWIEYEERCFPGYIFVETNEPKLLSKELREIEGFTRLVGFGNIGSISYTPLSEVEERMINSLIGKDNKTIELSSITFEEGNRIRVLDGPLLGFEGKVIKYNLHKRTAMVEIDLGGIRNQFQLGIDVIERMDK